MTGKVRTAVVLVVVAGALTVGCSVLGRDEWVPLDEALGTRQEVRDRTQDLAAIIADQGLVPFDADGSWTGCTDDSYAYQYVGDARLDADGPSANLVGQVVDALVTQAGLDTDGPGAYNNPDIARGTLGDVDVRVRGYAEGPEFMLEVFGPCMPIAPEDRDDLDQGDIGSQDIEIGGTHQVQPQDYWVPLTEALTVRRNVRDTTQQLAAIVTGQGLEPIEGMGHWAACTDDRDDNDPTDAYWYYAQARFVASGLYPEVLERITDAEVAQAGLQRDVYDSVDGLDSSGTLGGLAVEMYIGIYADEFTLYVTGPCLPIAPEDRGDMTAESQGEDLDIAGPVQD